MFGWANAATAEEAITQDNFFTKIIISYMVDNLTCKEDIYCLKWRHVRLVPIIN